MSEFDIAYSDLTECHYFIVDGKKYDITEYSNSVYEDGYQQGRQDEQAFVESRCRELGIDYNLIFTCNSAD